MNESEPIVVVDSSNAEVVTDSSNVEVVTDSSNVEVEVVTDSSNVEVEVVTDSSNVEVVVIVDSSNVEVEVVTDSSNVEVVTDSSSNACIMMDVSMMEIPTCCYESWGLLTEYMKQHEINNLYSIFSTLPHLTQANVLYTILHTYNVYKILVVDHDIGYITDMFLHNKSDAMVLAYSEEPIPYRNIVADYLKSKYENRYFHINSVNNGYVNISSEHGYSPLFDQVDLIFINGENNDMSYVKNMIQSCKSLASPNAIVSVSYKNVDENTILDNIILMGHTKLDTVNCMAWGKYGSSDVTAIVETVELIEEAPVEAPVEA
jgi:hypothetical protein